MDYKIKVRICCMGSLLGERWATPMQFREMLRHPRAVDQGWRMAGCCTFKITDIKKKGYDSSDDE